MTDSRERTISNGFISTRQRRGVGEECKRVRERKEGDVGREWNIKRNEPTNLKVRSE